MSAVAVGEAAVARGSRAGPSVGTYSRCTGDRRAICTASVGELLQRRRAWCRCRSPTPRRRLTQTVAVMSRSSERPLVVMRLSANRACDSTRVVERHLRIVRARRLRVGEHRLADLEGFVLGSASSDRRRIEDGDVAEARRRAAVTDLVGLSGFALAIGRRAPQAIGRRTADAVARRPEVRRA